MKIDQKKTLFLIDGSSFLYRAYYGLKPLHTPLGVPVQAVFSFCRMIRKMIDKYGLENVVLVWDSKGKTTRHEIFADYKATRQAPPSDIFDQKEYIIKFATLIGMAQKAQAGIEADDIMYSLAKEWLINGDETVVFVTLDKDMGQALSLGENIYLLDAFKDEFFDRASLEQKMGFSVKKIPFYFALLGDSSDNIPGVKGIGKKTALELVSQYESLQDMYDAIETIKKVSVKNALLQYKENAFLSYKLFLLQYHTSGFHLQDVRFDKDAWMNALPLFNELNFKSLVAQIVGKDKVAEAHESEKTTLVKSVQDKIDYWQKHNFITVTTQDQLNELCDHLQSYTAWAVDTETTGLQPLSVDLVGISFCAHEDAAYYVPCGHQTNESQLSLKDVLSGLKPLLENSAYKKYLHNAKYDQLVFSAHGIELAGIALDTLVAVNLIRKDWQSASLKKLVHYYFNEEMLSYDDVVKTHRYKDFSYVPLSLATLYAAADSYQTLRLVRIIEKEFKKEPKIASLYTTVEHPLIELLYQMEKRGIYVDVDDLSQLNHKVEKEISHIQEQIAALIGKNDMNLNSPRQIELLLFDTLQLPPQRKSKTGKLSTDYEVLKALAQLHPVPALLIKYRELTKLKNTYIDSLPHYVNVKTNHIHTTFSQIATATGRLASSNPNLQNIPTDMFGYGIEVRAAFKAEPGRVLISADYSQIELRVLAYLSQDSNLLDAFLTGKDIHTQTSAGLFDVIADAVTNEQRQLGKRINFSILYGLTPYGLSKDLDITFKEAKKYIEKYFAQYPQISEWMGNIVALTKENGYVETLFGRRRFVPTIYEKNRTLYEEACRMAINTVVQGTAAEIMKLGMLACSKELALVCPDASIILQIHDELIVSAPEQIAHKVENILINALEGVVAWNVPLVVKTRRGHNWKDITK